ncbi:cytosolic protein [Halobacillus massiliensis]|uniref:cytosolic protein n=1 Tax=Halobacillus massiliensis TaxID=1926286 RepID=UPI0009E3555E|nr:cytosolic protein [Halobacillus massiliensis]
MQKNRDMAELTMMSKNDWINNELSYYHDALSQIAPYLNQEGVTLLREINNEIKLRGGLTACEASLKEGL